MVGIPYPHDGDVGSGLLLICELFADSLISVRIAEPCLVDMVFLFLIFKMALIGATVLFSLPVDRRVSFCQYLKRIGTLGLI